MNTKKSWKDLMRPRVVALRFLRMGVVAWGFALGEGVYRYIQDGTTGYTHQSFAVVFSAMIVVEMFFLWRFFRR